MRIEKHNAPVFIARGIAKQRDWTLDAVRPTPDGLPVHVRGVRPVPVEGRCRRLTRFAAYVALARAYADVHCECEEGEPEVNVPHYTCRYHDYSSVGWGELSETPLPTGRTARRYGNKLIARLARYLRWLDQREREVRRLVATELA